MAKKNDTTFFENKLLDFVTAKDPMLEMLQWVMDKFMEIEVAHKTGAEKGIHAESRTGYRCGYRIRRFDTRLGTVYLSVPKLRQGGYIPFFVTEKKRSEQALIQVVQECWLNGVSTRKIEKIAKRIGCLRYGSLSPASIFLGKILSPYSLTGVLLRSAK